MTKLRIGAAIVILLLAVFVALSPGIVYAPTPRVILYFLVSVLPAILFAGEISARFELKLPGFAFAAGGALAVCFGSLYFLTNLSKPEEKIAVFHVFDRSNQPVPLDWRGALEVPVTGRGLAVTKFVEGNTVILVFPEQVGEAELRVRRTLTGPTCVGTVTYAGTRTSKLILDEHLSCQ